LPKELAKSISGETEEEIQASAKALKELLDSQAQAIAEAEIAKRFGGKEPSGGTSVKKLTEEEIEKLPTLAERQKARRDSGLII
jgi:DNA replicative helicase MCM subunit Mcm2 (Cdc46/Mcm family)